MNAFDLIIPHLRYGEQNAVGTKRLCALTSLKERELRRAIELLRRQGVPILSSVRGYFLPATLRELKRFIEMQDKRAKTTFKNSQQLKRLYDELALQEEFNPLSLFDENKQLNEGYNDF